MNLSSYFTLPRQIYTYGLMGLLCALAPYGQAQAQTNMIEPFNTDTCQSVYQLAPSTVHSHDNASSQWWFEPYQSPLNMSENAAPHSLALKPANTEKVLDAGDDTVLISWRTQVGDALQRAKTQPYFIVRTGAPIRDMNGHTVGSFSHLIAKARWDTRLQVTQAEPKGAEFSLMAPLRVVHAVSEVDKNDRVIPRVCLNNTTATDENTFTPTRVITQAQIIGLADAPSMGTQSNLAIMDKGGVDGVNPNQTWFLVDALSKENKGSLSVTRTRGQVELVQVFERYSLIRIQHSEREVMRGMYLQRATQDD